MKPLDFPSVVLASTSPRRRELLTQLGVPHEVLVVDVDETPLDGEAPAALAQRLAAAKARAGLARSDGRRAVLGSDTVVEVDGRILGKPADRADALAMLAALSGTEHRVMTAVVLAVPGAEHLRSAWSETACACVPFRPRRRRPTGTPASLPTRPAATPCRAGRGVHRAVRGSYSGVMGLPLFETARLLQSAAVREGLMRQEILINVARWETRAALLENGVLQEVYIERTSRRGLVGNIYKGRVSRVLPGMQAAFIEIGLERTAFLHASDIAPPALDEEWAVEGAGRRAHPRAGDRGRRDPRAGAEGSARHQGRAADHLCITFRRAISCICRRATAWACRRASTTKGSAPALRELVLEMRQRESDGGGYIVRTAAEGAAPEALRADMLFLRRLWELLREQAARSAGLPAGARGPAAGGAAAARPAAGTAWSACWSTRPRRTSACWPSRASFMPNLVERIELYAGNRPIFDLYGVEDEIAAGAGAQGAAASPAGIS